MSTRQRLPNHRPSHSETLETAGQAFTACVGFDPETGQPREIFLNAGKEGSMLNALLADAAVAISIALQHGIPAATLAKSIGRLPAGPVTPADLEGPRHGRGPASPIGAAARFGVLLQAETGRVTMDTLYLWRVSKRGHRVHIKNPETGQAYCQAENCSGGKPFDGRGKEVPPGRQLCKNCTDLAGRNEADCQEPDLKVLMGERLAETEPRLFPSAVSLPISPQKRPRSNRGRGTDAIAPKPWKRKRPKRSNVKYLRPFNDDLPW